MTCLGKMSSPNAGGPRICSCTNFCRPRTKVQVSPVSLLHFPFRKISKRTTAVGENLQTLKKRSKNTHTHTHFKNQKQRFFAFSFMFAVKFFTNKVHPPSAIHRLINFRKVTFLLHLERIQATGSTANMPLWILQAPPWAQVTRGGSTGEAASCNPFLVSPATQVAGVES